MAQPDLCRTLAIKQQLFNWVSVALFRHFLSNAFVISDCLSGGALYHLDIKVLHMADTCNKSVIRLPGEDQFVPEASETMDTSCRTGYNIALKWLMAVYGEIIDLWAQLFTVSSEALNVDITHTSYALVYRVTFCGINHFILC